MIINEINKVRYILHFIFYIQNFILCQDDVDIQLIEEIAQKDAMEDINLFKYRESYYVPEERILNLIIIININIVNFLKYIFRISR